LEKWRAKGEERHKGSVIKKHFGVVHAPGIPKIKCHNSPDFAEYAEHDPERFGDK
jgi:hypothetical protein